MQSSHATCFVDKLSSLLLIWETKFWLRHYKVQRIPPHLGVQRFALSIWYLLTDPVHPGHGHHRVGDVAGGGQRLYQIIWWKLPRIFPEIFSLIHLYQSMYLLDLPSFFSPLINTIAWHRQPDTNLSHSLVFSNLTSGYVSSSACNWRFFASQIFFQYLTFVLDKLFTW